MLSLFFSRLVLLAAILLLSACKLTLEAVGGGSIIASKPLDGREVNCSGSCEYAVTSTDINVFTAIPDDDHVFVGWNTLCKNSLMPCIAAAPSEALDEDLAYTLSAQFVPISDVLAEPCEPQKRVRFVSAGGTRRAAGTACEPNSISSPRLRDAEVIILLDRDGEINGSIELEVGQQLLGAGDDGSLTVRRSNGRVLHFNDLGGRPTLRRIPTQASIPNGGDAVVRLNDKTQVRGLRVAGGANDFGAFVIDSRGRKDLALYDLLIEPQFPNGAGLIIRDATKAEIQRVTITGPGRLGFIIGETRVQMDSVTVSGMTGTLEAIGLRALSPSLIRNLSLVGSTDDGMFIQVRGDGSQIENVHAADVAGRAIRIGLLGETFVKGLSVDGAEDGIDIFNFGVPLVGSRISDLSVKQSQSAIKFSNFLELSHPITNLQASDVLTGITLDRCSNLHIDGFEVRDVGFRALNIGFRGGNRWTNGTIQNSDNFGVLLFRTNGQTESFESVAISNTVTALFSTDSGFDARDLAVSNADVGFEIEAPFDKLSPVTGSNIRTRNVNQPCLISDDITGPLLVDGEDCAE
ncbi:MAG: right-handed parallel beta-helix repeat-containing protein [Pseudomonadota bacterium]